MIYNLNQGLYICINDTLTSYLTTFYCFNIKLLIGLFLLALFLFLLQRNYCYGPQTLPKTFI